MQLASWFDTGGAITTSLIHRYIDTFKMQFLFIENLFSSKVNLFTRCPSNLILYNKLIIIM